MRIIVGQLRYQASSFYNVVLFHNEKALSWDFSAWGEGGGGGIIVGQLRYQASSFYNVVLFHNEKALSWDFSAWGEGGGGGQPPPPVCWANKASRASSLHSGQYWLIIKINGTNFVGNSVNFVGNTLSNRNFS